MTREEAWRRTKGYLIDVLSAEEADEIIKALEQQPCEDTISRRETIKMFTYNYKGERIPDYDCDNFPTQIYIKTVKEMLRGLPSVEPDVNKQKAISELQPPTDNWETYADRLYDLAYLSGYNDGLVAKGNEDNNV